MASSLHIRPARGADDYPRLVDIWRSSVLATHDFLAADHRDAIEERFASDYFPNVRLTVAERDGVAVGFAGTVDGSLEMLFIDADHRGEGVGTKLLDHVIAAEDVTAVDVNEQNEQAYGFYLRRGFTITGRSPVDAAGLPYPLLHMRLARG
ncbi:acetyltransferase [Brevibacterium sp. XM4083]|uniref:acetyltransferase n=1 Tax=Brevibacterium sp. XM4083 TaxID=2583238 RepID=UPI0011288FD5|nr:acetyltransferase [Brevibacterium sp. XM4083]MCM1014159.1 acetyltransferase [Brevibacterium sp. XM4083]